MYTMYKGVWCRPLTVCLGGKAGRLVLICAKSGVYLAVKKYRGVCSAGDASETRGMASERQTEQAKPK